MSYLPGNGQNNAFLINLIFHYLGTLMYVSTFEFSLLYTHAEQDVHISQIF